MSLLQRIKSVLGLNGSRRTEEDGPVAVTVEHDPSPEPDPTAVDEDQADAPPTPDVADEDEDEAKATPGPIDDPTSVTDISGIGPSYSERLGAAGIETVGDLAAADAEAIAAETDLSEKRVSGWIATARDRVSGD